MLSERYSCERRSVCQQNRQSSVINLQKRKEDCSHDATASMKLDVCEPIENEIGAEDMATSCLLQHYTRTRQARSNVGVRWSCSKR